MRCGSWLAVASAVFSSFISFGALAAEEVITIVSGPKTGTYYAIAKDIAQVGAKAGVKVEVKTSEGSIDNIKRLNGTEGASLGIVQSDVLGFLSRSKSPESMKMASNLRMVFPFHNEEVHVLARGDIKQFSELSGKRVAVGEDGSGNMLTAVNLFSIMGITPGESRKIAAAQGVVAVLKGELDAVIFVGGKPVRLFKNLEDLNLPENQKYAPMLSQVHFLPMDDPKMLEEYRPASITQTDYSFVQGEVPTVAVQAVMVSYDLSAKGNKRRCEKLGQLAKALQKELPSLVKNGHPKWKEVNLTAEIGHWQKDGCAWPEAAKAAKAKEKTVTPKDKEEAAGLMKILEKSPASTSKTSKTNSTTKR